jgi:hypothetical protein
LNEGSQGEKDASSVKVPDGSKEGSESEADLDAQYPAPTEEESQTLRKVAGSLPLVSFALCLVEFAERASYYGAKTVFSNFIQFPLPEGKSLQAKNKSGNSC